MYLAIKLLPSFCSMLSRLMTKVLSFLRYWLSRLHTKEAEIRLQILINPLYRNWAFPLNAPNTGSLVRRRVRSASRSVRSRSSTARLKPRMKIMLARNAAMTISIRLLLSLRKGNTGSEIVVRLALVSCKSFCFILAIFNACNTCR